MILATKSWYAVCVTATLLMLAGCGAGYNAPTVGTTASAGVSGEVHGGAQPIAGATVQLWTVGTSGDGSAATPLLSPAVMTNANGGFSLANAGVPLFSCTNATQVYLTATGGNPGSYSTNNNIVLMAALGPCTGITSGTTITVNELTTVAAVEALAPYMTGYTAVGSGTSDASALAAAFTLASEFVNPATGTSPGLNVPNGYTVPTAELNTLADILATCVNSAGGAAGTMTSCGSLFTATTVGNNVPNDTVTAMLNVAKNPTANPTGLFGMVPTNGPFQPVAAVAPPSFAAALAAPQSTIGLQVSPGNVAFASTVTAQSAQGQQVYLENISSGTVTLSALSLTGPNAADYAESTTCGASLAAGSFCTVSLTFTPSAQGTRTAYLTVPSSATANPQYVTLTGTGVAPSSQPQVTLSTYQLQMRVGGASEDITLTNTGSGPLSISSVANATPYFTVTSHCGAVVAAGASCALTVTDVGPTYLTFPGSTGGEQDQVVVTSNDPAGPALAFLPPALNNQFVSSANVLFPGTVEGSSSTRTFNFGPVTSPIEGYPGFTITGPNAADFAIQENYAGLLINPYTVTFTPSGAGTRTAQISLGSGTGYYIPVVGVGLPAAPSSQMTLSPASLSFTNFSATQPVTLTNFTSNNVNIQSIAATAGFSQTNNCGSALYAQSICTILVSSTLSVQGGLQGALNVTDDLGVQSIGLATNVDPILNFQSAALGTTSPLIYIQTFTGNVDQTEGTAALSGANPGDFLAPTCYTHGPGPCGVDFSFTPTATGSRSAVAAIAGTQYDASIPSFLLQGSGVAAGPNVAFGTGFNNPSLQAYAFVGGVSTTAPITLYNAGTTTLNLSGPGAFASSGTDAADFTPSSQTCANLIPETSCTFVVSFRAARLGLHFANVVVTDGNSGASFTHPILGVGQYNGLSAGSFFAEFPGSTPVNGTVTMPVTVSAGGDVITATITSDPADFSLTKSTCAASESPCILMAEFHPVQSGNTLGGTATLVDNRYPGSTSTLYLGGVATGLGFATVSPTSLTYSSRPAGTTSIAQMATITNTGTAPLTLSAPSLSGMNATEFVQEATTCSSSLAANASCTVSVSFAPVSSGYKVATLVLAGETDTDLPVSVTLTGTAQ